MSVFLPYSMHIIRDLFHFVGRRLKSDPAACKPAKPPMTDSDFRSFLDGSGRLRSEREFRERVYQGGIEHNLRKVAWRHLLNVFPPGLVMHTVMIALSMCIGCYCTLQIQNGAF